MSTRDRETVMAQAAMSATRDAREFAGAVAVAPSQPVEVHETLDFDPMENYVYIKPEHKMARTEQGIHLPIGEKRQDTAIILGLSRRMDRCTACNKTGLQQRADDHVTIPCPVCLPSIILHNAKVGDRIMCSKIFTFDVDGKTVFVVREADIIGVKK